nr:reverse transcriptase domain-containing protein [Tanacetum cinerariifolium]
MRDSKWSRPAGFLLARENFQSRVKEEDSITDVENTFEDQSFYASSPSRLCAQAQSGDDMPFHKQAYSGSIESGVKHLLGSVVWAMMSPGGSIVASLENVNGFLVVYTLSDDLIYTDFEKKGFVPEVMLHILEEFDFLLGRHSLDNKIPCMVVCKVDKPWGKEILMGGMVRIHNAFVHDERVCIDLRKLNEATRKDHFPLSFMDQILERLAGNQYYCFLNGFSGYFQIPIDPKDQEKTTFTFPYRTFAYRRMPFGLCNSPGTFQRCMMAIFHDMIEKTLEVFMDDFSVFGNSFQSCLSHLERMLKRCEDTNLCLNREKSQFMVKEGIVLSHKISKQGIEVDKAKVDVITKLPHPTTVKGIQSFLGHVGFYHRFIKDFSKVARPMTRLLKKDTPFIFSKECVEAFQTLKRKLNEAPILIAPNWDMPIELMCDASDFTIGAGPGQCQAKHFRPIHYASKTMTEA